jgi:hypothetical protein
MSAPGASLAVRSATGDDPLSNMDATSTPSLSTKPSGSGSIGTGGAPSLGVGASASKYSGFGTGDGSMGAPPVVASMSMSTGQVFGSGQSTNSNQNPTHTNTASLGSKVSNIFDIFSEAHGPTVNRNAPSSANSQPSNMTFSGQIGWTRCQ